MPWPTVLAASQPNIKFPSAPRERIAVASYPFRDFIAGPKGNASVTGKIEFKDFAAHVAEKFKIKRIEPWSDHFPATDEKYLDEFRAAVEKAGATIVNIAVDGEHSPYARDKAERAQSVAFSNHWVDVALAIGSPSVRTSMAKASDSEPNVERAAESLAEVVAHAAGKNIVVNLENDNPVSEDPFFIVKVLGKVNSSWLHALPDFANTLVTGETEHAYQGIGEMFPHAYNICHVKEMETNEHGRDFHVDMHKTFGILKNAHYKGYCSMEFDSAGDPYQGTARLIESTLRELA
ncbi:MAG: sugar phosphate isomerase/epimerase [Acidobacteriota bacterium]|nr:sugar phosphate isomerase/epimerase [Acidobacteriota bacterium]